MITEADYRVIDRCFDPRTLARGRAYASRGAVSDIDWGPDGTSLSGSVVGSRARPYEVNVGLVRGPGGRLESVDGECSCPVGYDCKHVAAVLLSSLARTTASERVESAPVPARRKPSRKAGSERIGPAWESLLDVVLPARGGTHPEGEPSVPAFALQFELVTVVPARGRVAPAAPFARGAKGEGATTRIRVRPVVRGSSGNWVRQGVSWRTVDYIGGGWFRREVPDAHVPVLKELRALSSLSAWHGPYARYHDSGEEVWLDSIASRRVWDLLGEAKGVGIPLVGAGRSAVPVTLHRADAELMLDASATPHTPGITLVPRLAVWSVEPLVVDGPVLPIGTPPHGIAWWDSASHLSSSDTPPLSFARLAVPLTARRQALLSGGRIVVPHAHEARFFDEIYPRLRRYVRVRSSDGSVAFPDLPEESLILGLRHLERHRLELAWATGVPGTEWRERLRDADRQPYEGALADALAQVRRLVLAHPTGRELAPAVTRMEPEASLEGMAAVRFLSDVLPALEALPGLAVEHHGQPLEYREVTEAPEVTLAGTGGDERDWFDLAVQVRVGGEVVPFVDLFMALASGQADMLLPSGAFFSLEHETLRELAQLIGEARALHDSDAGHICVNRYQASLWEDLTRLGVLTSQATEWERSVRALVTSADRIEHPPPAGLVAQLRPYQLVGFNWLVYLYDLGLGGVLADDMGLGKTLQVLALVEHVRRRDPDGDPFLVVAPTSVVGNWAAECRKFAPGLRVETVHATSGRRGVALSDLAARADVVVTSYALFRLEYDGYEKVQWAGLVLDEAQFAKNMSSHAYQRAKTL
ncbi:MAG: SNF2-related protein, partial [Acidimicrobiales bacterium]